MIDVKLTQASGEHAYDISFENGDVALIGTPETAILLSLYSERRADVSEVPVANNRRGWVGNVILYNALFEIGSKLWLLEQSRVTENNLLQAKNYTLDALQWLIDREIVDDIDVDTSYVDSVTIKIDIQFFKTNLPIDYYSLTYDI